MRGCFQHAETGKRNEGQHVEGAGARPEDAVIKADHRHKSQAEDKGRHALVAVDIRQVWLQREVERNCDQQEGHEGAQHRSGTKLATTAPSAPPITAMAAIGNCFLRSTWPLRA